MDVTNQASTPPRRGRSLSAHLPGVALLLVLAASAALFAYQGWSVITFPYPVDYGEGPLLDQSIRLARFENIYDRDLSSAPYAVANYPPLYLLAQTPWIRVFGPALWYGRLLSWLCVVASALLTALILRALGGDWLASIVGGTCLLVMPYAAYWAPMFRIDTLALALSLAALYVLVRAGGGRRALLTSAVLLTAAAYTRQTYVLAAPLAACAWLAAREGERRRAYALAALVIGAGGSVLLVVSLLTDGGFLFHTLTANVNAYRLDRLFRYLRELASLMPGFLLIGAAFLVAGRRIHATSWRLVAPYVAAAALASLTIGKVGSNVNYFLELCAAASLAVGATLAGLRSRPMARNAVILLLLVQVSVLVGGTRYQQHLRWKLQQRPVMDELMDLLHHTDGTVLADEALGLLPLAGRPVHVQPFELTQLAYRGAWDPTPFLEELDRREFAAVLVHKVPWSPIHRTRWTPEMLERLERGYDASGVVGHTVVYRPRSFDPAAAPP